MTDTGHVTDYGFTWGPMEVIRASYIPGRGWSLHIDVNGRNRVQIGVSEQGRSVRVWVDYEEVTR